MDNSAGSLAIINARIVRNHREGRFYSGMVVLEGRVAYVGDSETASAIARSHGLEVKDAGGLFVLPGFIDAHLHVESLGVQLKAADLSTARSIDELIKVLKEKYSRESPKLIVGRGWDQERLAEKRMPTARDLDRVSKDVPVVAARVCGHVVAVNSVVLEMMKEELERFDSKEVPRDEAGRPIGLLFEDAGNAAWSFAVSFFDRQELVLSALRRLASLGVTSAGWMGVSEEQLESVRNVYNGRALPRLHLYLERSLLKRTKDFKKAPFSGDFVRVSGIKLFADGSLGARTAYLSEDYSDAPEWRGVLMMDESTLAELSAEAIESGLQPAVHAIGDEAIRTVLRAFRRVRAGRHDARIEHASLAPPDVLAEMSAQRVIAVIQPRFALSDWWAVQRLGDRVRHLYPFRDMLERGVRVALSTDSPVEPADPWETVRAAELNGSQSLSRATSLSLYTEGSAVALRRWDLGKLEVGCKADFIVTDFNPYTTPAELLVSRGGVLETYVNGVRVY